jgi:hypothetical protein
MSQRQVSVGVLLFLSAGLSACADGGAVDPLGPASAPLELPQASVDLSVTVTDAPDPVQPGGSITHSIVPANLCPGTAAPFTVIIDAPLLENQACSRPATTAAKTWARRCGRASVPPPSPWGTPRPSR